MLFRKILSFFLCIILALSATFPVFAGDRLSEAKAEMNSCLSRIVQIDVELNQLSNRSIQISSEMLSLSGSGLSEQQKMERISAALQEISSMQQRINSLNNEKGDLQNRVRSLDAEIQNLQSQQPIQQNNQNQQSNYNQGQQQNQNQNQNLPQQTGDGVSGNIGYGHGSGGLIGERVNLRITVENDGVVPWTFYAAVTVRKPNGEEINLDKQSVYLVPGETSPKIIWEYTLDQEGSYDVIFGLWKTPGVAITCSRWFIGAFSAKRGESDYGQPTVQSPTYVNAIINGSGVHYGESKVGYPVSFKLNILNTGNTAHDFSGAVTIRHSDGSEFNISQKSVFLNPNESSWAEFTYYPDRADTYDYILGIWSDGRGLTNDGWVRGGFTIASGDANTSTPTPVSVTQDGNLIGSKAEVIRYFCSSYYVKIGEPIEIEMDVLNSGGVDGDWDGAVTIIDPNGKTINLSPRSIRIPSGQSAYPIWIFKPEVAGKYDVIFGLWKDGVSLWHADWLEDWFSAEAKESAFIPGENMSYPDLGDNVCRLITVIAMNFDSRSCKVTDGITVSDQVLALAPVTKNGVLYIPLRSAVKAMGGGVYPSGNHVVVDLNGEEIPLYYSQDLILLSPGVSMASEACMRTIISRAYGGDRMIKIAKEVGGKTVIVILSLAGETFDRMVDVINRVWSKNFGTDVALSFKWYPQVMSTTEEVNPTLAFKVNLLSALIGLSREGEMKASDLFINLAGALGAGELKLLSLDRKVVIRMGDNIVGYAEAGTAEVLIRSQDDVARLSSYVAKYGDEGLGFVSKMTTRYDNIYFDVDIGLSHAWLDSQHSSHWVKLGINSEEGLGSVLRTMMDNREKITKGIFKYTDKDGNIIDEFGFYDSESGIFMAFTDKGILKTAFIPNNGKSYLISKNLFFSLK